MNYDPAEDPTPDTSDRYPVAWARWITARFIRVHEREGWPLTEQETRTLDGMLQGIVSGVLSRGTYSAARVTGTLLQLVPEFREWLAEVQAQDTVSEKTAVLRITRGYGDPREHR